MFGLEWYWWVLIVAVVIGGGYLKIKVGGKILAKMNKKKPISNQKD
jgi:hypothetical protein